MKLAPLEAPPSAPTIRSSWHQSSFLGGEWSPYAQGRIELPAYKAALNLHQNAISYEEGCWTRRPGFKHCGYTNAGGYAKLFDFPFSGDAPYAVEVSWDGAASWIRFWRNDQLVTDTPTKTVSGITSASPAVVTTSTNHGWSTDDHVVFTPSTSTNSKNLAQLLGIVVKITVTAANKFSMVNSVTGANIDGSTLTIDGTITVARVTRFTAPYTSAAQVADVRAIAVPDNTETNTANLWLLHRSFKPIILDPNTYPTIPAFATFTKTAPANLNGPYVDSESDGATASAATGSITFTNTGSLVNGGAGWTSADIGRCIRILTEPDAWFSGTPYAEGDVVTTGTYPESKYWVALSTNSASDPNNFGRLWAAQPGAGQWTWGTITAVTDTTHCTLMIMGDDLAYYTNIVKWQMDLFSDFWGWPQCGAVHNGRLWLSTDSSIEGRFDASEANNYLSFNPTSSSGAVGDGSAISYTITESPVTNIRWMLSDSRGLLIGRQRDEFILQATPIDAAITPRNIDAKKVSRFGSALGQDAVLGGSTVMFLDRTAKRLMELIPDTYSGKHTGRLLNDMSRHMGLNRFVRHAYTDNVVPILWSVDNSGGLFGTSYRRIAYVASQPPDMNAWHRHSMGTTWVVKDICASSTYSEQRNDILYAATYDGTYYHVEVSTPMWDEDRTSFSGHFLDSSPTTIVGRDPALDAGSAGITFYGLTHLNGKTVTIFIAGLNFGTATVSGGTVTVNYAADSEALGTASYLQAHTGALGFGNDTVIDCKISGSRVQVTVPVVIGCAYTSAGQTVRPNDMQGARLQRGPGLAEYRRVYQIGMLLHNSGSFSVGTSASHLYTAALTDARDAVLGASTMFSGVYWDTLDDDPSFDGMVYWQTSGPYPLTVMSLTGFLGMAER